MGKVWTLLGKYFGGTQGEEQATKYDCDKVLIVVRGFDCSSL